MLVDGYLWLLKQNNKNKSIMLTIMIKIITINEAVFSLNILGYLAD